MHTILALVARAFQACVGGPESAALRTWSFTPGDQRRRAALRL